MKEFGLLGVSLHQGESGRSLSYEILIWEFWKKTVLEEKTRLFPKRQSKDLQSLLFLFVLSKVSWFIFVY